jgi:hypothetical protein
MTRGGAGANKFEAAATRRSNEKANAAGRRVKAADEKITSKGSA